MNQVLLQKDYQEQINLSNDFFEDASKCDVCGSKYVYFTQKQNGILRECLDCIKYQNTRL